MNKPLVAALLSSVLLAACGSTVPLSAQQQAGLQAEDGLGSGGAVPQQDGSGSVGGGLTSNGSPGTTDRSATGATTGVRTSTPGTAVPGGGVRPSARAAGPVKVGLLYLDGIDTVAQAFGISGLSTGDAVAQAKAVVAYLNTKGGIDGRRVELRTAQVPAADSGSEGAYAAACAELTQDQKVDYVVSYVTLNESRLSCYASRGVPVLNDQSFVSDTVGATYADLFAAPGELAPGRATIELVEALWRTGWLTARSKVGSLVYDTPAGIELETRYLAPALARHGLKLTATARPKTDASGADQSGTVLRFRSAGVDRVIPLGASPLFLMNSAESQQYRPQYAVNSSFGPGALLESAAPPAQLRGSKGIGWSKFLDIGKGTRPGPVSSNETLCLSIMRSSRQASTSTTVQAFQLALCSVLFVLKDGGDRYGLTPGLLRTLRAERYVPLPTDAFQVQLVPGRADGVVAYRDLAYQESCSCFQYTSGNRRTS